MGVVRKALSVLKNEGIGEVFYRASFHLGKKGEAPVPQDNNGNGSPQPVQSAMTRPFVDVLFINGCDASVPHPARYRVTHQREQLAAYNLTTDEVYYIDLQTDMVKYAHVFVFFRCPYTETIGTFIETAKELNKKVLFDIDDLVVDTKYTDSIKYLSEMTEDERALYDDGVNRMGRTLKLCEGAITTTERLAEELGHYVPTVFINRNVASEKMFELSEKVDKNRCDNEVRIGYFSGSITHNDDFLLVMPVLVRLMKKYPQTRLYLVGELDLPDALMEVESQVVSTPFVDWQRLPQLISQVDINIAPLEQSIFNEAKSENKWVEAALVHVVTVASNVGAFARMIQDGETGYLCGNENEWMRVLENLILSKEARETVADKAYAFAVKNCLTINTGRRIAEHIQSEMTPSAIFCLPSTEISGGIMVALRHAGILQKNGFDVTILADKPSLEWMEMEGRRFPVLSLGQTPVYGGFDKAIATMWLTSPFVETHPHIDERYYLVQNYEVGFYPPGDIARIRANQTYNLDRDIRYITISRWCQEWLRDKYGKHAAYAPNGIDTANFYPVRRDYQGKIRILIEGDCSVEYKGVDESFRITNRLDPEKYEIWYMSYNASPKAWYRTDKFLHRIPYHEVSDIYRQCHILLKSSTLESFSYPPLEMMATGGIVIVVPNGGNSEYLEDGVNCLTYDTGDEEKAVSLIGRIADDEEKRETLYNNGINTAAKYDWKSIENRIYSLYQKE